MAWSTCPVSADAHLPLPHINPVPNRRRRIRSLRTQFPASEAIQANALFSGLHDQRDAPGAGFTS